MAGFALLIALFAGPPASRDTLTDAALVSYARSPVDSDQAKEGADKSSADHHTVIGIYHGTRVISHRLSLGGGTLIVPRVIRYDVETEAECRRIDGGLWTHYGVSTSGISPKQNGEFYFCVPGILALRPSHR